MLRKSVYLFALMAVLFAQFVTAHHNVQHIGHDGFAVDVAVSYDHTDHEDGDDQKQRHQCPECLLTKSLLIAFEGSQPTNLTFIEVSSAIFGYEEHHASSVFYKPYNSRAPPAFLV